MSDQQTEQRTNEGLPTDQGLSNEATVMFRETIAYVWSADPGGLPAYFPNSPYPISATAIGIKHY
jgi:hypothetical protein